MRHALMLATVALCAPGSVLAQPVFSDGFDTGSSLLWGNERGDWIAAGGRYFAQAPNNNPLTWTSLPYSFTDLEAHILIRSVNDGGVWLHADAAGENGILLVFAHRDVYWHVVVNGNPGPALQVANDLYNIGDDLNVRVQVSGNNYWAFLPGFLMPVSTLNNAAFPSGRIGLYDFTAGTHSVESFDISGACVGGCCPALVASQPVSRVICRGGSDTFVVSGAGSPTVTYQWQIAPGSDPLNFTDLEDGPFIVDSQTAFTVSGSEAALLEIDAADPCCDPGLTWSLRCTVQNACGVDTSTAATLRIGLPADLSASSDPNNAGYGVSDGLVDASDFFYYLDRFSAGDGATADLTGSADPNDPLYGLPDGSIDAGDFFYYLDIFVAGCP